MPAHINKPAYSMIANLGFVPRASYTKTLEVRRELPLPPLPEDSKIISSSDAHTLADILERVEWMEEMCIRDSCYAIHAEQNAIIQAAKLGVSIQDATLYCTHQPCVICTKMIINAGIKRIVYKNPYPDDFAQELLKMSDIQVDRYDEL